MRSFVEYFCARGFVVFAVDHRLAQDFGNAPTGWPPPPPDFNPTWYRSFYPAVRDGKAALRWIHANAQAFGVSEDHIAVIGGSAGAAVATALGLSDPEDFTRRVIDYGASLAEEAGRLGLTVALEIMERRKREFVTDIPAAARIARGVDSPSFGLTVDLAHLLYSGAPVEIEGHESIIFHVHISGSTRERVHVPLAEGIYDLKDALARLRPFFRGIVVIESYAREREMQAAGDNKREFDQLMREIDTAPPGQLPARSQER